jgi:hypothetical protein
MLGVDLFRGLAYGLTDVGEGIIKAGGNVRTFGSHLTAGGLLNGNVKGGLRSAAMGVSASGIGLAGLFATHSAANAPRGKTATRGFSVMTSMIAADVVGGFLGGPIGQIVAQATIAPVLQTAIEKPLEAFAGLNHRVTHLGMGGDYEDTELAYTMRQRAAMEMGSSLLNARQYLGLEAKLFHQ